MSTPRPALAGKVSQSSGARYHEIRQILRLKEIRGSRSVSEWISLLDKLGRRDLRNQSMVGRMFAGAVSCGVCTVLLAAIGLRFGLHWVMAGAVVTGVTAAYLSVRARQLWQADLNDGLWSLLLPFLKIIPGYLDTTRPVDLDLNLSGPTRAKIMSEVQVRKGRFTKIARTVYWNPWCRLVARLPGRNKLFLRISDVHFLHEKRYRTMERIRWNKVWNKRVKVTVGLLSGGESVFDRAAAEAVANMHRAAVLDVQPNRQVSGQTGKFRVKVVRRRDRQFGRLTCEFRFQESSGPVDDTVGLDDVARLFSQLASILRPARGNGVQA